MTKERSSFTGGDRRGERKKIGEQCGHVDLRGKKKPGSFNSDESARIKKRGEKRAQFIFSLKAKGKEPTCVR